MARRLTDYTDDELADLIETLRRPEIDPDAPWQPPTPLVDWTEAYGLGENPAQWLAEPLLPEGGAVALFAKGGTGKSLLALWIAAGLATGRGLVGPVDPVDVLYLDYEMTILDVVGRLEDMGYEQPDELKRLHYASLPTLPTLDTAEGGRAITDMATRLGVRLVVIDTFGRAVDGEEDKADTVRAWYRWTGQLLKSAGVAFLRTDHAGKDVTRGQRGSSAKNDDVDVVWEMVDRAHGDYELRTTKRRVSWVPERLRLVRTETNGVLGFRWDDRPTYSGAAALVAELLDQLGAPLDISRRRALTLLREADMGRNNNVVAEALRYRRDAADESGTTPGYHPDAGSEPAPDTGHVIELFPQEVQGEDHPVPSAGPQALGGGCPEGAPPGAGLDDPFGGET
jgi:hypothetical protein